MGLGEIVLFDNNMNVNKQGAASLSSLAVISPTMAKAVHEIIF